MTTVNTIIGEPLTDQPTVTPAQITADGGKMPVLHQGQIKQFPFEDIVDLFPTISHLTEATILIAGQTAITVSDYVPGVGAVAVFLNGTKLQTVQDFTETNATTITLLEAGNLGDIAEVVIGYAFDVTLARSAKSSQNITGVDAQTVLTTNRSYTPGSDEVEAYFNGSLLTPGTDFTETNPTTITLLFSLTAGDQIRIIYGQVTDILTVDAQQVGEALYPQTAAEIAANVTPSNYLYAPGNVKRYGATGLGTPTSDLTAVQSAAAQLADGGEIVFPGNGTYYIPGDVTFTESRITVRGEGNAVLDFADNYGFVCSGDQSDITFDLLGFTRFGAAISPNSQDVTKTRFTVTRCKFYDSTTNRSHYGVFMWCRIKGAVVTGNYFYNIGNSAGVGNNVYAIILGEKGDNATRTPDPTAEGDYGDTGAIDTAESGFVVSGNIIRKLRGNSDNVTGILVDGWRGQVTGNTVEDVYSADGAGGGKGIYTRGHEMIVANNNVSECTGSHITQKALGTVLAVGDAGHAIIIGNTCFSRVYQPYLAGIETTHWNATVSNNKFYGVIPGAGSTAVVYDTGEGNTRITDNEFYKCGGRIIKFAAGTSHQVLRNKIMWPLGKGASEFEIINSEAGLSYDISIEDNETILGTNYTGTNTIYNVVLRPGVGEAITGLSIKRNKVRGLAAFRTVKPAIYIYGVQILNRKDGQVHWHIEDNVVEEAYNYSLHSLVDVQMLSATTVWPSPFTRTSIAHVDSTTAITLRDVSSGLVVTNVGASGTLTHQAEAATPGQEFILVRVAAQAMRFEPNGTDTVGDGAAGKYLEITKSGAIKFKCFQSGKWTLTQVGAWDDPGASGTPVPGFIWET